MKTRRLLRGIGDFDSRFYFRVCKYNFFTLALQVQSLKPGSLWSSPWGIAVLAARRLLTQGLPVQTRKTRQPRVCKYNCLSKGF
jgi:hypothetical protein